MGKTNYVYILQCSDHTLYTGWTTNLEERLKVHNGEINGNGAKYTRGRRPVELVYSEQFDTKSEALKREIAIKKMNKMKKWALVDSHKIMK